MSRKARERAGLDPFAMLRDRCERLSLPVWRCNAAGVILAEPAAEGLIGLFLSSNPVSRSVAHAVADLSGDTPHEPISIDAGCWLLVIPEIRRKRLAGYIAVLAMGQELFQSGLFTSACASGQLDLAATRRCLRDLAIYDHRTVSQAMRALRWMVEDLEAVGELDETVSGFTEQLANAYETIDLLYALGHSMNEPNEPAQFIDAALQRLHEAMDFAWLSAIFVDNASIAPGVHDRLFLTGVPLMTPTDAERALRRLVTGLDNPRERVILSDIADFAPDGGPQLVVQPIMRAGALAGHLIAGDKGGSDPQVSSYDTHLMEATSGYIGPFLENASLYQAQQQMFLGTLRALSSAIDAKDPYTCGHSERVAHLSARLAEQLGFPGERVERIHIAGLVHDVGKIGVPEAILGKKGKLSDDEFASIREHPAIGYRIVKDIPMLGDVLPGVLHHHERWDGAGYPSGLVGEAIPLIARIICICDTFDAMSSTRSYRPAMTRQRVLDEIRRCAATQFDPDLIDPFLRIDLTEYDSMVEASYASMSPSLADAA